MAEENASFEPTDNRQNLDTADKLTHLSEAFRLLPETSREANEAMSLTDPENGSSGGVGHVVEIYKHQQKAKTDDPNRAVKTVVNEYIGYFDDSRSKVTHIGSLSEDLNDIDNPTLLLSRLDLRPERTDLLFLARFRDISDVRSDLQNPLGGREESAEKFVKGDYDTDIDSVKEMLETMTVAEARVLIQRALGAYTNRRDFWKDRLVELAHYMTVEKTVLKALGATSLADLD